MGLTLRQIRDNTASARKLMAKSRAEKFAVGAFKLDNQETLKAVCRVAVANKSPVIVEVGQPEAESIGIENIRDMVDNYKEELGIDIYVNLYHSPDIEMAIAGIEAGFEFINVNITEKNRELKQDELISKVKLVVDYARLTGALVEAELPYVISNAERHDYHKIKNSFSTSEGTKRFIDSTGADIFAVSIGNLHEEYPGPKVLDLDLLKRIRKNTDCSISLHGGSGVPDHYFIDAVKIGVSKISVDTDLKITFRSSLEDILRKNPNEIAVASLMDEVIGAVQDVVEEKIGIFGSSNKMET